MITRTTCCLVLALIAASTVTVFTSPAQAKKPIQLALVAPIQIFPDSETIIGFRFNLLYGRNANMNGFDLGLANHITGAFKGVELGAVNWNEGQHKGLQWGMVNLATGSFVGAQLGAFNYTKNGEGVQLGIVNYAERIHGLQIGLVNIIRSGGWLPVMIIVNGSF